MALSRPAREIAAEIRYHDWSDAPYRLDRAGHQREDDRNSVGVPQLTEAETANVRTNVMWVAAQVLAHADPNFDVYEFAEWCGVDTHTPTGRPRSGVIAAGLRKDESGGYDRPGGPAAWDDEPEVDPGAEVGPVDRRPDQQGTDEQRGREWPANPNTRGFVTPRSRNVHRTTECKKYVHTVNIARKFGRRVHDPVWTSTGIARSNGKGICSHCWTS